MRTGIYNPDLITSGFDRSVIFTIEIAEYGSLLYNIYYDYNDPYLPDPVVEVENYFLNNSMGD